MTLDKSNYTFGGTIALQGPTSLRETGGPTDLTLGAVVTAKF